MKKIENIILDTIVGYLDWEVIQERIENEHEMLDDYGIFYGKWIIYSGGPLLFKIFTGRDEMYFEVLFCDDGKISIVRGENPIFLYMNCTKENFLEVYYQSLYARRDVFWSSFL